MSGDNKKALTDIQKWIARQHPSLFISIQLPFESRTQNPADIQYKIQWMARKAQRGLLGRHWCKKYYPFTGVYEGGGNRTWHAHILLSSSRHDKSAVTAVFDTVGALYKTKYKTRAAPDINIKEIYDVDGAVGYCTKQLGLGRSAHIQSDRIFTAETLFNLPVKQQGESFGCFCEKIR